MINRLLAGIDFADPVNQPDLAPPSARSGALRRLSLKTRTEI
jgi:hypothetical protein